tara:strand:- start:35 stop:262 length:228 start_codon:yes stop_codon:yes gene_type:complete
MGARSFEKRSGNGSTYLNDGGVGIDINKPHDAWTFVQINQTCYEWNAFAQMWQTTIVGDAKGVDRPSARRWPPFD